MIDWSNDQPCLVRLISEASAVLLMFYAAENNLNPLHASRVLAGHSLSPLRGRRKRMAGRRPMPWRWRNREGKLTSSWSFGQKYTKQFSLRPQPWSFAIYKGWPFPTHVSTGDLCRNFRIPSWTNQYTGIRVCFTLLTCPTGSYRI